eukprot:gb/GECG01009738.1/.p1 GENE.gb/GECG01009738.1/~~gb/GECG01009738.1/.p1  ORF type:complete len:109 (+),score=10.19 gb/GECG01009738.1/:1-327(+)
MAASLRRECVSIYLKPSWRCPCATNKVNIVFQKKPMDVRKHDWLKEPIQCFPSIDHTYKLRVFFPPIFAACMDPNRIACQLFFVEEMGTVPYNNYSRTGFVVCVGKPA